jgi:tRNA(adenine34) deaminase
MINGFIKMGTQLHPKTVVLEGILENQCSGLMKHFFKNKRK